jgi:tRNA threonylcarbamoyladenosine biosynthesis protein TsaE
MKRTEKGMEYGMKIDSFSAEDTFELGIALGAEAKKGEVYCLSGDLGVGKTVFTQGFAKGIGISEAVSSPTFTIIQEYTSGRVPLYHFDVYRIADLDEMEEIGYLDYFYGDGVCLIEWAELIEELLPENPKRITIRKNLAKGFDYREITIE